MLSCNASLTIHNQPQNHGQMLQLLSKHCIFLLTAEVEHLNFIDSARIEYLQQKITSVKLHW